MEVWLKKFLRLSLVSVCWLLPTHAVLATAFTFPGTNPPLLFSAGTNDSLTVQSGTMATTSGVGYTVSFAQSGDASGTITVNSGATLQYSGSNTTASTILFSAQSASLIVQTITNNGTISSNTGLFAIYLHNSQPGATNTATINNANAIIGSVYISGLSGTTINIYNNSSINGTITAGSGNVDMHIGRNNLLATSATTYTTLGTLQNINNFHVYPGSTANLNLLDSSISVGSINGAITVDAAGILNVNGSFSGTGGSITNSGTMNISANVAKTGTFTTASGAVTNIYEAVTISTSNYVVSAGGTHNSVLYDVGNYGNATFSTAVPNINTFGVVYNNGYFPAGTYTLATSSPGMTVTTFSTPPASTLFLTFGTPTLVGTNTVQITLSRVPFQQIASTILTQQVGAALESIGSGSTIPSASMLTILDQVELSTTSGQLDYALSQLEPLACAPLYGLEIQTQNLNQVELRLAEIRRENYYVAGDISHQYTVWLRGYGDSANQQPIDDIAGYYATTGGAAMGIDRLIDTGFIIGGAFSYCLSHVTDKRDFSSLTNVKSYQAMLYGSYNFDPSRYVDWIVGAAANDYTASRNINLNGLYLTANSSYSSQQFSAKGTWGKIYSMFDFLEFAPEVSALYSYAKQYPYTETGAGGANLAVERDNSNLLTFGLIGKLGIPLDLNPGICYPEGKIAGYYNLVNGKQNTIARFAEGGSQFITGMTLQRTALVLGFAVTFAVIDKFEVKLNYEHTIEDRFTDNAGYINLKYTF